MPKDVKLVIGAGGGGGLVSWAFTIMTGSTFGLDIWTALPLSIILGIAAALVAVYVITPTDVTKVGRLIGYAVLCGFLWKPVLDAGRIVIDQRIEAGRTADELKAQIRLLRNAPAEPAAVAERTAEAAGQAAELLRTGDRLGNTVLAANASAQARETIEAISDKAEVNSGAATLALVEIRQAAEDAGDEDLAVLARTKIQQIERFQPADGATITHRGAALRPADRVSPAPPGGQR